MKSTICQLMLQICIVILNISYSSSKFEHKHPEIDLKMCSVLQKRKTFFWNIAHDKDSHTNTSYCTLYLTLDKSHCTRPWEEIFNLGFCKLCVFFNSEFGTHKSLNFNTNPVTSLYPWKFGNHLPDQRVNRERLLY